MPLPRNEEEYAKQNPGWHQEDARHKAGEIMEMLARLAWKPQRILDVGAGTGHVAWHMRAADDASGRSQTHYVLYEPHDVPNQVPESDRLTWTQQLPPPGAQFDLALCLDVFEHVTDDVRFLQDVAPLSKHWLFRIPLDLSVLDVVRPHRLVSVRRRYGHRHTYTADTALSLLREAGYRPLRQSYVRVPPTMSTARARLVDLGRRSLHSLTPRWTATWFGGFSLLVAAETQQQR